MLLDPFEEQLDLPTALVERGDRQGWQAGVVLDILPVEAGAFYVMGRGYVNDSPEGLQWHELHHLCEKRLAHVHASTPRVNQTREHCKTAIRNSNRGHP
ncbi:MAG: hypothetical protein JF606_21715 [Burkholderiales bacterium]|nr:hypothetical protein [Burkholderiales bacterium]